MNQPKRIAAWLALLLASSLSVGCSAKKTVTAGTGNSKTIYVYPQDCTVDSEKLKVSKEQKDTVRWKYYKNFPAQGTITFVGGPSPTGPKTPCVESGAPKYTFYVKDSHHSDTCVLDDNVAYGEYKYTVKVDNGCTGPDPSVDVQN